MNSDGGQGIDKGAWTSLPHRAVTPASAVTPPSNYTGPEAIIVFTDIEGSTALAQALGEEWSKVVTSHHSIVHRCFDSVGGFEASNQGDGFVYLFGSLEAAASAALEINNVLDREVSSSARLRVRIGIHIGEVSFVPRMGLIGLDLHRCARISGVARGGQIIVSGEAADRIATLFPRYRLIEHGRFFLKDLRSPERIVEMTDGRDSAGLVLARRVGGDVPPVRTPLVGRSALLAELQGILERGIAGSVLTLCGTGGVGKTRLAVELLHRLTGRVTQFIDLSQIEDSAQVLSIVADALAINVGSGSVTSSIVEHLQSIPQILVLDNLEQVIEVAPELADLARRAPRTTVIATSRRPLRVDREIVVDIVPLDLGPASGGSMSPAAAMFVEIAGLSAPTDNELRSIERICELLSGLPLAIELAVGRLYAFSIEELYEELAHSTALLAEGRRDSPARHRALDAAVRWSYELLGPTSKLVARWLSQLPGGASATTMTSLLGFAHGSAMNAIADLADHHMVILQRSSQGETRAMMLRVIRETVADSLIDRAEESEIRDGCAQHLATFAGRAAVALQGRDQLAAYEILRSELENITNFFDWATVDDRLLDKALTAASRMVVFWWQGHLAEGIGWLHRLTHAVDSRGSDQHPNSLISLALLSCYGGDAGDAIRFATEAAEVLRRSGQRGAALATALQIQAAAFSARGEGDLAKAAVAEALEIDRGLPDPIRAYNYVSDGNILLAENEIGEATTLFSESLRLFEEMGGSWLSGTPMSRLAECSLRGGDLLTAEDLALRALEAWSHSPGINGRIRAETTLARIRLCQGRIDDAWSLSSNAAQLAIEASNHGDLPWAAIVIAAVESARRNHEKAAALFGLSETLAESYAQPIRGCLRHELSPVIDQTRSVLGPKADDLWARGYQMNLNEAEAVLAR